MNTVDDNQTFRNCLLTAVKKLRVQSADEWKHKPVLAKTLERMRDYLEVLLSSSKELTTENERAARAIWLDSLQKLDHPKIEAAFDIEADLRASLPELAGDDYTYMCLQREKQRLTQERSGSDSGHFWTAHFPESELDKFLNNFGEANRKFQDPQVREAAIGRLVELYKQSHHELRRHRAHAAQAGQYLRQLSPVLLLLLVVVLALLGGAEAFNRPRLAEGRWVELVALGVAMLAGAVGGILGLMLRFRDTDGRIRDLLSDSDVRLVQPSMGAAMALAVVLVVKSGLVTIGGLATEGADVVVPLATLGFVAGFSEPVFFGVVDRLARVTSPESTDGRRS